MRNTIQILVALLICSAIANGQINRTANTFTHTIGGIPNGVSSFFAPITSLDSINNITTQCWFTHKGTGSQWICYNEYNAAGPGISGNSFSLQFVGTTLIGQINDSTIGTSISDTVWHHVALIRSSDTMYMYLDGTLINNKICPTHYYSNGIGSGALNAFAIGQSFHGNMNDLRIDTSVAHIYYDTCNYSGSGSFIYAPMNNTDSTHVYANGVATADTFSLSITSPCTTDTTADTTISHVGVANINALLQEITIAPNPARTIITISSTLPVLNVCIQNMLGQVVYSNSFNANAINVDVQGLPSGFYFIKINNGRVFKIVKQ
jgi:hypothetical protein